jgi:hypothetical protein
LWILVTSVLEWLVALAAVQASGLRQREGGCRWLALAMLPALVSAMAACTWHLFDNSEALRGLVVLQAGSTVAGNVAVAAATFHLLRLQRRSAVEPRA